MNERIRELFKQAYGYFPSPIGEPETEKFAELIVRECAQVASDPLAFTEAAYCHARVLKHFGVEEFFKSGNT